MIVYSDIFWNKGVENEENCENFTGRRISSRDYA